MMIQAVQIFTTNNSKSRAVNSKSNYMSRINNYSQPADTFTKSKNKSEVTFTGLHGAGWYGTQDDRNALSYKVQLTPEQIEENIRKARTRQAGISLSYSQLSEEAKRVGQAFKSMISIKNEFGRVASGHFKEMASISPEGSKIPIIGLLPQLASTLSGSFADRLNSYHTDLDGDFTEIIRRYWNNGINPICSDYWSASNSMLENLYGIDSSLKSKLDASIRNGHNQTSNNYDAIKASVDSLQGKLYPTFSKIYDKQIPKQAIRTAIKGVTLGLGGFGVEELLTGSLLESVMNIGTDSLAELALNPGLEALTSYGLDSIGNTAKEATHGKSSNIIQLSEKSLVNVLRKIR